MMPPHDDSYSSDESWKSASDGEDTQSKLKPSETLETQTGAVAPAKLNTANFSGHGNKGWQIGQSRGGNFAQTINIYNESSQAQHFPHAAEYMQSLSSGYRQQKNANPARTPRTCEWFLKDERFQEWRSTHDAHLLHVFAAPGCGKSVLARALIDEGLLVNEQTTAVAYYFFKSGQGEQDRSFAAVAALLHQIYFKVPNPALKACAQSRYEAHGINLSRMFDELWDILIETTSQLYGNVVCVLDALDECDGHDRVSLISEIASFYARSGPLPNLKFLVLSRPYREVDFYPGVSRNRSNFIRFDGDDKSETIAQEINMVIDDKIPVILAELNEKDQGEIIEYLRATENRTYLWLYLILEYVQKNIAFQGTGSDIKRLLNELPPEIDEAYERMLSRSPYPELTRSLLALVLAAKRPLTIVELKLGLKIAQNLPGWAGRKRSDLKMETDAQFKKSLKDLCGLLLSVRNSQVYFIHETAREFLLSQERIETTSKWKYSFDLEEANALLTEVCFAYLSSPTEPVDIGDDIAALSGYTRDYWTSNYESSNIGLHEKLKSPMLAILEAEAEGYTVWVRVHGMPLLHKLCQSGLGELVKLALQLGAKVNGTDPAGNTALHIALLWRHGTIVPLLFERDVDLSARNSRGDTVFTDYLGFAPEARMRLLVTSWRAAKPRQPLNRHFFRGAIMATIYSKDLALLKLVLRNPSGFEASSADISTAIGLLYSTGYQECIQDLRESSQITSSMGGIAGFDSAVAAKVSLDEEALTNMSIDDESRNVMQVFEA